MPLYRIHRLREQARLSFRNAPHATGLVTVKPKDYEAKEEFEAENPYALWKTLSETPDKLEVGDVLADIEGKLLICKYIGFDDAQWLVIEAKQSLNGSAANEQDQTSSDSATIKSSSERHDSRSES